MVNVVLLFEESKVCKETKKENFQIKFSQFNMVAIVLSFIYLLGSTLSHAFTYDFGKDSGLDRYKSITVAELNENRALTKIFEYFHFEVFTTIQ